MALPMRRFSLCVGTRINRADDGDAFSQHWIFQSWHDRQKCQTGDQDRSNREDKDSRIFVQELCDHSLAPAPGFTNWLVTSFVFTRWPATMR